MAYPPGLPPQFDPGNMLRAGADVLEHGLPPLPEVLTYEMAIPVAYWIAEQCAVVLGCGSSVTGTTSLRPTAMQVTYSRGEDGHWQPPTHVLGGSFYHDPVRRPGSRGLEDSPMVRAGHPRPARSGPATR